MSQRNIETIIFAFELYLPWEKRSFDEISLRALPPNTFLNIEALPNGQPVNFIFQEKRGSRAVIVPAALTYLQCVLGEVVHSPSLIKP